MHSAIRAIERLVDNQCGLLVILPLFGGQEEEFVIQMNTLVIALQTLT